MVDRDININIKGDTTDLESKIKAIEQHIKQLQASLDRQTERASRIQTGEAGAQAKGREYARDVTANPNIDVAKEERLRARRNANIEREIAEQEKRLAVLRTYDPSLKKEQWEPLDPGPKIVTGYRRKVTEGATTYQNAPVIDAKLSPYEVEQFKRIAEERRRLRERPTALPAPTAASSNYMSARALAPSEVQLGTSAEELIKFIPFKQPTEEALQPAAGMMHGPWIEAYRKGKLRGKAPANIKAARAMQKAQPIDYLKTQGFVTGISGFDFDQLFEAVSKWGDVDVEARAVDLDKVIGMASAWGYVQMNAAKRAGDMDKFYDLAFKMEGMLTSLQRVRTLGRFSDTTLPGQLKLATGAKGELSRENIWALSQLSKSFIPQRPSEMATDFGSTHRMTQQLDALAKKGLAERVVSMHSLPPEMWAQSGMTILQNVFANSMNRWALTGEGKRKVAQLGVTEYPGYTGIETPQNMFERFVNPEDVPISFGVEPGERKGIEEEVKKQAPDLRTWRASTYRETPEYMERFRQTMVDLDRARRELKPKILSEEVLRKIENQEPFGAPPTTEKDLDLVQILNTQASSSYQMAQPQVTESKLVMDVLRTRQMIYADTLEGKKAQAQDIFEVLSSKRLRSRVATKEDALEVVSMVSNLVKSHRESAGKGEPLLSPDQYRDILNFWTEIESRAAPGLYGVVPGITRAGAQEQEAELSRARGGMKAPGMYAAELRKEIQQPAMNVDAVIEAIGESQLSKTVLYNEELAQKAGFPMGFKREWFDVEEVKKEAAARFDELMKAGKVLPGEEARTRQEVQHNLIKELFATLPRDTYARRSMAGMPVRFRPPSMPGGRVRKSLQEPTNIKWEDYLPLEEEFKGLSEQQVSEQELELRQEYGQYWEQAEKVLGPELVGSLPEEEFKKLRRIGTGGHLSPLEMMHRARAEAGPRANVASAVLRAAKEFKRGAGAKQPAAWRHEAAFRGLGAEGIPQETEEEWEQRTFEEIWGPGEEEEAEEVTPEVPQGGMITPEVEGGRRARAADTLGRKRANNLGLVLGLGLPPIGNVPNPIELIGGMIRKKFPKKTPQEQSEEAVQAMPNMLAGGKAPNVLEYRVNMDITKPEHLQQLQELAKKYPEMVTEAFHQNIVMKGGMESRGIFRGSMMQDIRGLSEEQIMTRTKEMREELTKMFGSVTTGYITINDRYVPALDKAGRETSRFAGMSEAVGKMSWRFTMLSMNALGVYFSMMSIVRLLQQGLTMMFNPLKNVEALIEDIGWLQSRGIDSALTPTEAIEGWMKLKDIAAMFTTSLAKAAVKILDEKTYNSVMNIMKMISDFITKPEITKIFQNIFSGLEKNMPSILGAFEGILKVLEWVSQQDWLVPFLTWATLMSWLAMPFLGILSALTRILQIVPFIAEHWGAIAGAAVKFKDALLAVEGLTALKVIAVLYGGAVAAETTKQMAGEHVRNVAYEKTGDPIKALEYQEMYFKKLDEVWDILGGMAPTAPIAVMGKFITPLLGEGTAGMIMEKTRSNKSWYQEGDQWYYKNSQGKVFPVTGYQSLTGIDGKMVAAQTGGMVTKEGVTYLHAGEMVAPTGGMDFSKIMKGQSTDEMIQILNNNYKEATNATKINEDIEKAINNTASLDFMQNKDRNDILNVINTTITTNATLSKEISTNGKSAAEALKAILAKFDEQTAVGMPGYPVTFGSAFGGVTR